MIVGLNNISIALSSALRDLGYAKSIIVDEAQFRTDMNPTNREILAKSTDFIEVVPSIQKNKLAEASLLIVASEGSALQSIRQWHEVAHSDGLSFLPVWIYDEIGYIGPLVVPNASTCFECLRARENSHLQLPEVFRAVSDGLSPSSRGLSLLPAMPDALGKLAALQLTKHQLNYHIGSSVNHFIRVDFLKPEMTRSRVLKVPRCNLCSSYSVRSAIDIDAVDVNMLEWIANE
jgi:thiazole/oxazole-forming peptide maturase SagC family component